MLISNILSDIKYAATPNLETPTEIVFNKLTDYPQDVINILILTQFTTFCISQKKFNNTRKHNLIRYLVFLAIRKTEKLSFSIY